jgi:TatA/E family protein of Tat protein translocase
MFGMSPWHVAILVVVGLFVFGPERLPTLIKDLGKALRQVRAQAQSMQEDIKAELGPEVGDLDLSSLHPRTFIQKNLLGEGDDDLIGLKALGKDAQALRDDATNMVRFDKSGDYDDPGPAAVDEAIPAPIGESVDMHKSGNRAGDDVPMQPLRRRTVVSPRGNSTTVSPGVDALTKPAVAAEPSAAYDADAT